MTDNLLYQRDIISMKNLQLPEVALIMQTAKKMKQKQLLPQLNDKVVASCFFEASTRTRLSFETAGLRLGAKMIGFSSDKGLSIEKGETLHDTMRVIAD